MIWKNRETSYKKYIRGNTLIFNLESRALITGPGDKQSIVNAHLLTRNVWLHKWNVLLEINAYKNDFLGTSKQKLFIPDAKY